MATILLERNNTQVDFCIFSAYSEDGSRTFPETFAEIAGTAEAGTLCDSVMLRLPSRMSVVPHVASGCCG
ncbi:MAG: hypothetical protein ACLUVY_05420 [Bacteroides uniformis]